MKRPTASATASATAPASVSEASHTAADPRSRPHPWRPRVSGPAAAHSAALERTALIPLAVRAQGTPMSWPWPLPWMAPPGDAESQRVLSHVRDDARTLPALWTDPLVMLNVLWRTQVLRDMAREFFARHPDAIGVNLGCGLSDPFRSLDTGRNRWIDADLPLALQHRHRVMRAHGARHTERAVDLRQHGWWQALGLPDIRSPGADSDATPVFMLCEGVMMHLTPQQVHAALHEFAEHAPAGSQWAMDVISSLGVGCAALMPSLATTGTQFQWGVRDLDELKAVHPRLELLDAHSIAECWGMPGLTLQALCWPWMGAPAYSVVTLSV